MAPDSAVAFVGSGKSSPDSAVGGEGQRDPSLPVAAADVQITASTTVYGGKGQRDPSLLVATAAAAADGQISASTTVYGGKGQRDLSLPAAAAAGGQISASTAVYGGERQWNPSLPVAATVSGEITAIVDGQNSTGFPLIFGDRDLEAGVSRVALVGDTCVGFGIGSTNTDPPPEFKFSEWDPKPHDLIVLFVVSEVLGMMFEVIYEDSHIVPYFIMWMGCVMFAIYSAN